MKPNEISFVILICVLVGALAFALYHGFICSIGWMLAFLLAYLNHEKDKKIERYEDGF